MTVVRYRRGARCLLCIWNDTTAPVTVHGTTVPAQDIAAVEYAE